MDCLVPTNLEHLFQLLQLGVNILRWLQEKIQQQLHDDNGDDTEQELVRLQPNLLVAMVCVLDGIDRQREGQNGPGQKHMQHPDDGAPLLATENFMMTPLVGAYRNRMMVYQRFSST